MTDTPDDDEELGEFAMYEPMAMGLGEDEALVFDQIEFAEVTNSLAAMLKGGVLFVLNRDTLNWVDVQKLRKGGGKLSIVKKD